MPTLHEIKYDPMGHKRSLYVRTFKHIFYVQNMISPNNNIKSVCTL